MFDSKPAPTTPPSLARSRVRRSQPSSLAHRSSTKRCRASVAGDSKRWAADRPSFAWATNAAVCASSCVAGCGDRAETACSMEAARIAMASSDPAGGMGTGAPCRASRACARIDAISAPVGVWVGGRSGCACMKAPSARPMAISGDGASRRAKAWSMSWPPACSSAWAAANRCSRACTDGVRTPTEAPTVSSRSSTPARSGVFLPSGFRVGGSSSCRWCVVPRSRSAADAPPRPSICWTRLAIPASGACARSIHCVTILVRRLLTRP